jgi:Calcium-dependent channel, 7TM region, putative phosphate
LFLLCIDTTAIIDLLANSLPKQSTYFIQILLVDTAISLSVELLRVAAVGNAAVRAMFGPNLTEKERETTWMGIRPLADPSEFGHADLMAITVLYFVVYFVYAVLAPITSAFMFICFLLIGAAYRHQFVYIYPTKPDSGGALYVQFMKLVPSCILIGEVTIVGFLALKRIPSASALMLPLLIITILFVIYLGQQHFRMTKFLSARQCMATDRKNNVGRPMDMDFAKGQYVQPEMREKKKYPENASLERQRARGMVKADVDGGEETFSFSLDGSSTSNNYQRGALEHVLGGRSNASGV